MITAKTRGWLIVFEKDQWIYADNKIGIRKKRACRKCGQPPTAEGHDACLGKIHGAISACCGHGAEKGFILRKEKWKRKKLKKQ